MRRSVKILVWFAVFAGCAGAGAYVAAHSDPFPPGVEDPGARPTGSDGAVDPTPAEGTWLVRMDVRTFHDLYVGGRCAANWGVDLGVAVTGDVIDGAGAATLKGEIRCEEPNVQVQAERIELRAVGDVTGGELRFRLEETGRTPVGAQDLAGFVKTLPTLRFELPAEAGSTADLDVTVPDGDRGTYGAVGKVVLGVPPGA